MDGRKDPAERRKHVRYLVKYGAFFVHSPNWSNPGEVIDISKKGLACFYFGEEKTKEIYETGKLYDNDNFCLEDVSFKTVSDFEIASSSITMRRRSIQFEELSRNQQTQLKFFIRDNTF